MSIPNVTTHGIKFVAWEDETTAEICETTAEICETTAEICETTAEICETTAEICEAGDCSRGDAQGIIEACPALVGKAYAAGFTPFEAAKFILQETAQ